MPAERLPDRPSLDVLFEGIAAAPRLALSGISEDSRQLDSGFLFLACQGATRHGLEFAGDAIAAGVAAVAWDASTGDPQLATGDVPFIAVDELAARLGELANRWHRQPSADIDVVGVTGTNGKSTVAWLAARALTAVGDRAGYLGTLGVGLGELETAADLTTPGCLALHATLADFRERGAAAAAIEVSSHGLVQGRLQGVSFDTAIFTNLSRDHIDYHGSMAAYGAAKAALFTEYSCRRCIVNIDDAFGRELAGRLGPDAIVTSVNGERVLPSGRHVIVTGLRPTDEGTRVRVSTSYGNGTIDLKLVGEFNVANAIEVLALLLDRGVAFPDAAAALAEVAAPPGRLQRVQAAGDGPDVYVDYAHTPAALEAVLRALRPHARGRIWCVFGCGGDRDRGKRPQMGRVVSRLADRAVITNDNPRGERPAAIIAEIQEAMTADAFAIEDRGAAIAWAIAEAAATDTVLIAGKGHEDYQIIGAERLAFSDYDRAVAALALRGGGST